MFVYPLALQVGDVVAQLLECGLWRPSFVPPPAIRLRALIRRGQQPLLPERLSVGLLTLDTRSRHARMRDRDVALTAKEYAGGSS